MLSADRILQQQYRTSEYHVYSDSIYVLLQAEQHDELLLRNHHQRPIDAALLPEVLVNVYNNNKFDGSFRRHPKNFNSQCKCNRKQKSYAPDQEKCISRPKLQKSIICRKCGCYKHSTKKYRNLRHLVDLYLQSVGRNRPTQG